MGGSTSRNARDPSGSVTRRTIVSPAGCGATEAPALACAPGASPGTTLSRQYVHASGQIAAERAWTGSDQTKPYGRSERRGRPSR